MVMTRKGNNDYGLQDTYRVDIPITDLAVGATPPAAVTVAPFRGYAYTISDDSYFETIVPADWESATAITITIRWACNENYALGSGEVQWRAAYETVDKNNQVLGAGTTATVDSGDVNIPTTARQIQQTTIGTMVAANLATGDTIGVTLSRIALAGGADPTAEPEIYACWLDYTRFISNYN